MSVSVSDSSVTRDSITYIDFFLFSPQAEGQELDLERSPTFAGTVAEAQRVPLSRDLLVSKGCQFENRQKPMAAGSCRTFMLLTIQLHCPATFVNFGNVMSDFSPLNSGIFSDCLEASALNFDLQISAPAMP